MFYRIMFIALAVMVVGCSDPKAANEKNFKMAIQKTLDAEYPKCYVTANFPATIGAFDMSGNKASFKALVSAGLLSEKEEMHEVRYAFNKKNELEPTYYLTDEGNKFYKTKAGNGGFCFGKATVKEITQFTEPSDMGGIRTSRVNFTYTVSDFPAWAKSPEILSAISRLKEDVESESTPLQSMDVLALTNNGWVSQLGGMLGR